MCGLAGFVLHAGEGVRVERDMLVGMTRAMQHRGPDDEGYYWTPEVGLGSRRLSIIDLSPAGRMPMSNEDGSVLVLHNGEIYNFQALREHLCLLGHSFRSRTDTEVIVHLYEEAGEQCVRRLDGMFAIAIWDSRRRRLVLARDRFGEKPLYYAHMAAGLVFASELKALVGCSLVSRELNHEALEEFLTMGYVVAPRTPYQRVFKLPPAHYLVFEPETRRVEICAYWDPPTGMADDGVPEREYIDRARALLVRSVESRLVSDVPIGAFLSGGIDSSLVVAAMSHAASGRVRTVSIGHESAGRHDENPAAAEVARALGVEHHRMTVALPDVRAAIEQLPWISDEPIGDPALIAVFLITRFARERGLTVMLSGDGGDELCLGYPTYRWVETLDRLYRLPTGVRGLIASGLGAAGFLLGRSRLDKAARALRQPDLMHAAQYVSAYGAWSHEQLRALRPLSAPRATNGGYGLAFGNPSPGEGHVLDRQVRALMLTYLPDNNLARMDRAAMANSVETRAPLLAPEFAEFAIALPRRLKLRGSVSKYVLRALLADFVTPEIANRPKRGFDAFPMAAWLRSDLRFLLDQYLDPTRLRRQGLFDPDRVSQTVREHMAGGRHNHWWRLWLLTVLQMWLERWGGA